MASAPPEPEGGAARRAPPGAAGGFIPPIIAVTSGEPAGIGPELCAHLADVADAAFVVIGDEDLLATRARSIGRPIDLKPWKGRADAPPGLYSLHLPLAHSSVPGQLDSRNSPYVLDTLTRAARGCSAREFDALVTAPVHKGVINEAGFPFTGHTEFFSALAGNPPVVMMLAGPVLRVALATTHLPLSEVPRAITREGLTTTLLVLDAALKREFGIARPRIGVLGLNPHAGESGHLGREEIDAITPVIQALNARGLTLVGPLPADTAFLASQRAEVDAYLAMYHDQGLPVLKALEFGGIVNITLGLPWLRVSVDHGTALSLAGTGRADPGSLLAATRLARTLISARSARLES